MSLYGALGELPQSVLTVDAAALAAVVKGTPITPADLDRYTQATNDLFARVGLHLVKSVETPAANAQISHGANLMAHLLVASGCIATTGTANKPTLPSAARSPYDAHLYAVEQALAEARLTTILVPHDKKSRYTLVDITRQAMGKLGVGDFFGDAVHRLRGFGPTDFVIAAYGATLTGLEIARAPFYAAN